MSAGGPPLAGVDELLAGRPGLASLCARIEAWDPALWRHSQAAALLAGRVALQFGVESEDVERVRLGGLVHDAGKILWPVFMRTSAQLGPLGMALIRMHPIAGAGLVRGFWPEAPGAVVTIVREHHERWAGGGYPEGPAGEGISFPGRIVGAVEAFCAMREPRAYRPQPIEPIEAVELLRQEGHDPTVVEVLEHFVGAEVAVVGQGFGSRRQGDVPPEP